MDRQSDHGHTRRVGNIARQNTTRRARVRHKASISASLVQTPRVLLGREYLNRGSCSDNLHHLSILAQLRGSQKVCHHALCVMYDV